MLIEILIGLLGDNRIRVAVTIAIAVLVVWIFTLTIAPGLSEGQIVLSIMSVVTLSMLYTVYRILRGINYLLFALYHRLQENHVPNPDPRSA